MTIEEAIKSLKNDWFVSLSGQLCVDMDKKDGFLEAVGMALSALRAQQEAEKAKEPIYPCTGCNSGWATYNSYGLNSCHRSCERLKAWWAQAKEAHNV